MSCRLPTRVFFLFLGLSLAASSHAQTQESAQPPAASSAAPLQRIITKDPDYNRLLSAPFADDFVRMFSKGYQEKTAEIEATVAGISDAKLREQARTDEWAKVPNKDQVRFRYEADVTLNDERTAFSQKHSDGWMEIGLAYYDENEKALIAKSNRFAPIDTYLHVSMDAAAIQQIYDKFRQIAAPEIEKQAHDYVSKSGADSPCAKNAEFCLKTKQNEIEQDLRSKRMVAVAQGDLEKKQIDRYLLVDYITESVLAELPPPNPVLTSVTWRFLIAPVPPLPVEPEPVATPPPPVVAAAPEPAPVQPPPPVPVEPPPAPVKVPANVTAAAILEQPAPHYPAKARTAHVHGDVVLHAIIGKDGKISELHVLTGDDLLSEAAVEAVKQWRYKPMLSDGEPSEVETTITVTFSLQE